MTKTRSSMKILACLMAVVAVLCSFAISASAMERDTEYTPTLSGLPASHASSFFDGNAKATSRDTITVTFNDPITIGGVVGHISNVALASTETEGYKVSFDSASHVLTITVPENLQDASEFSIDLDLTIGIDAGGHQGGSTVASTLTLTEIVTE